jgi:hypothetical protein
VDEQKCNVHRDPNQDPHPHACVDGFVYLGYLVFDEEIGAEVERIEVVPCRRCEAERGEHG